jgi:hypothetical protein
MPTHKDATERAPPHGWDNRVDLALARKFLKEDASPFNYGPELLARAIDGNLGYLRSLGIMPKTAVNLLRVHWADQIEAGNLKIETLVRHAKKLYASALDEPGTKSAVADSLRDPMVFKKNQFGKPIATDPYNLKVALTHLGVTLRLDTFQNKILIDGLKGFGPILQDDAINRLRFMIRDKLDFLPDETLLYKFLLDQARLNSFNPAKEYFDRTEMEWDGKRRLDKFLITYAGAENTPYVRAVGKLALVATIRRIRRPGCKFDEMLVLESAQGKNKSTALEILAVKPEWFTDSVPINAGGREILEHVEGKLFVEVAELQGMRKGEVEHIKAVLSRTVDRGRMAYGRLQLERPRQFIFIGTSNGRSYLRDETGNRRFWPVAIKAFDLEALRRDLEQIWAEAAWIESSDASIRLDPSLYEAAGREQNKRMEIVADPFTEAFRNHLGDRAGRITSEDAWTILGATDAGKRTPDLQRRFGAALKANGFKRQTMRVEGHMTHGYVRGVGAGRGRRIVVTSDWNRRPVVGYEDESEEPSEDYGAFG